MHIVINDVDLHYEEYGFGIPVLCLHGFYVDCELMKGCLEPVFENNVGYKRIYLDLVGMGQTPPSSWVCTADDMLNIVLAFIQKVIGNKHFILFGESYGGYLALGLTQALKLQPNFARGTFAVIDAAGHNLQLERPELFSYFVEDFLARMA